MERICATTATLLATFLLSAGLALAQGLGGYAPGVNPSNPQDLTNRSNPQSLTVPGASNPQDLVRSPSLPRALSPAPARDLGAALPPLSSSLGHTYIVKPTKKWVRRKHGASGAERQ